MLGEKGIIVPYTMYRRTRSALGLASFSCDLFCQIVLVTIHLKLDMHSGTLDEARQPSFDERHEALRGLQDTHTLPDRPTISLGDEAAVATFLARELGTERLERIYWMLFLVARRQNISSLHHQLVKGRQIVLTERPDLHLVWNYDRIFIKPLPRCLLNHSFWDAQLQPSLVDPDKLKQQLRLDAQGFVRTYAWLITHESDFDLAQKLRLLPQELDWHTWSHFIQGFALLRDTQVAPRYHYGELRLARLNFWSRVLLRGSYFEVYDSYGLFFARFGGPYLLVYGAVAVVLAALQTAAQIDPQGGMYRDFASGFVLFSIVLVAVGLVAFPVLYAAFLAKELFLFIFRYQPLLT